jgi:hypothetical protein
MSQAPTRSDVANKIIDFLQKKLRSEVKYFQYTTPYGVIVNIYLPPPYLFAVVFEPPKTLSIEILTPLGQGIASADVITAKPIVFRINIGNILTKIAGKTEVLIFTDIRKDHFLIIEEDVRIKTLDIIISDQLKTK